MGKWDFDGDEVLFFLVAGIAIVVALLTWYLPLARVAVRGHGPRTRWILALAPLTALAGLGFVLTRWADPQYVVGQLDYQLMFLAGGGIWLCGLAWATKFLGVSPRDDALERQNPSAAYAIAGAILGGMAIYAGSNVGAGPTIWTTILPALVATIAWLALWSLVEMTTHPAEAITIDRDAAAGIRQGAWLLAAGLILGRASSGDWTAWSETFGDTLRLGWISVAVAGGAAVLNVMFRPTPQRPNPPLVACGVVPAAVLLGLAVAYVVALGSADIGKHVVTYEEYMRGR